MNKSEKKGMALHQAVSFFPLMMQIPAAPDLFWPGCALLNLEPRILSRTMDVLGRAVPGIRLAAGCCGQPSFYLFPARYPLYRKRLLACLKKSGVLRIYTACPNCALQLRMFEEEGIRVIPVWSLLAGEMTAADLKENGPDTAPDGSFFWHDPCPTRNDPVQQAAARTLFKLAAPDTKEPEHTGPKTLCCGNFHMMHTLDPEKSARMRKRRLEEFPEDRVILSNCEGCLSSFSREGCATLHLLELLFGKSRSRGWKNRIRTTLFYRISRYFSAMIRISVPLRYRHRR